MSYYRQGPMRPGGPGIQIGVPPVTPYIKMIMIACAVVWFTQTIVRAFVGYDVLALWFGVVPSRVIPFVWQPFTSMFLHSTGDIFHLLFNMLYLWMFGGELERYWGSKAFLRYYLICGVVAGIAAAVWGLLYGTPNIPTIGASGAIFGVLVAYGVILGSRTVLFMMLFPMQARWMVAIFFGIQLLYLVQGPAGVSYISHVAGGIAGFLYLKRVWRFGEFYRELRWRIKRRRFRVAKQNRPDDFDRWVN